MNETKLHMPTTLMGLASTSTDEKTRVSEEALIRTWIQSTGYGVATSLRDRLVRLVQGRTQQEYGELPPFKTNRLLPSVRAAIARNEGCISAQISRDECGNTKCFVTVGTEKITYCSELFVFAPDGKCLNSEERGTVNVRECEPIGVSAAAH